MRIVIWAVTLVSLAACSGNPIAGSKDGGAQETYTLGFDPSEFDASISPADDIWQHVNGKWLSETEIPPQWPAWGVSLELYERTEAQIRALVGEAGESAAPAPGSDAQKIGDLYRSFMDTEAVEAAGLSVLDQDFARIDALDSREDVIRFTGYALRTRIDAPVSAYIDADGTDPTRNLLYAWQGGLTLPNRDYYLEESENYAGIREQLAAHIEKLFVLAGRDDGAAAAATILDLESRIAAAHWPAEETRVRSRTYSNRYTMSEAIALSNGFDWRTFFAGTGVPAPELFVLATDSYFPALTEILSSTSVADWQSYYRFKLLETWARYLPEPFVAEDFDFHSRILRGQNEQHPRWRRGVALANGSLGEILGRMYVERHFSPETKIRVEEMVENLRTAFGEAIDELDWMTPQTKEAALAKLERFDARIGYPDEWRDYSSLEISSDLVENVRAIREFEFQHEADKLSKPVDRSEWSMTPQTVNAYYRATFNVIAFPAAYIQPPQFDPAADDAFNYGAMGSTIGHEFSHGFDDQGRRFDGDGRLRDWWTDADAKEYSARAEKLVAQYDAFRPLPDVPINGRLTLGENIGDLAGLTMAYRAWRLSLAGAEPEVIGGYTGDQRFFIGWVNAYRSKMREGFLRQILLSDPHSPNEFRVRGVLPNMPEFHAAFDVQPGDGMYLAPEDRVKIW